MVNILLRDDQSPRARADGAKKLGRQTRLDG
jgi:hypothetical protein